MEASVIFDTSLPSARSAGIGGAITATGGYAPVLWKNPAGIAGLSGFQFISAQTQKFSLANLAQTNITAGFPTRIGAVGLGYSRTGDEIYKESVFSFVYANTITPGTDFGLGLKTMNLSINEYGSATTAGIDIGVQNAVSQTLALGFSLSNANSPYLGVSRIPVLKNLSFGLNYKPAAGVLLAGELEKIEGHDIATKLGFENLLTKDVYFRSGLRSNPTRFSFGIGFGLARFLIDYAFITHPALPTQHFLSFGANFAGVSGAASPAMRDRRRGDRILINKVSAEELAQLSDIMGRLTARRIIEYREKHGPFKSIDDLRKIPRLRETTIQAIESYVSFETAAPKEEKTSEMRELSSKPAENKSPEIPKGDKGTVEPAPEQRKAQNPPKKISGDLKPGAAGPTTVIPPASILKPVEEPAGEDEILDINAATAQDLEVIGFTSTEAKNIIRFRKRSGGFNSVDDLLKVPGINRNRFDKYRESLRCPINGGR